MLVDKRVEFCDDVTFSGNAGTAYIGNSVDLSERRDVGATTPPLYFVIVVKTTMVGGASAQFELRGGNGVTGGGDISAGAADYVATPVLSRATLAAGATFAYPLPQTSPAFPAKRYLQVQVTRVGNSTAGAIDAFLTCTPPKHASYPDAQN